MDHQHTTAPNKEVSTCVMGQIVGVAFAGTLKGGAIYLNFQHNH